MYYVILCLNTWMLFYSENETKVYFNEHSMYTENNECIIQTANPDDIDFYRSPSFKPIKVDFFPDNPEPSSKEVENNKDIKDDTPPEKQMPGQVFEYCHYEIIPVKEHTWKLVNICHN